MSIQDIQADPQDTSNFYLASIHQALTGGSNLSSISLPSSPPAFTPPTYGIWVNSLWFLSLVISMTCAVLANLLQQWARKYLKVTQPRSTASEPRRAHYRAFYADGVENFYLPWVFEALPAMLHVSVFLFFAGLVVFLWNFDPTISKLILSWVAGCVVLYGYITFIPTFRHDSPYNTPLSPLAWSIVTGVPFISLRVFKWISYFLNIVFQVFSYIRHCCCILCLTFPCLCRLLCCVDVCPKFFFSAFRIDLNRLAEAGDRHRKLFFQGMQKTAEKTALGLQTGLSRRAFMWTFDTSHEDEELECFFSNLPVFRRSKDFLDGLTGDQKERLWSGLIGFLDRTLSSDTLLKNVKTRRAKICADALDPQAFPYILDSVIYEDQCAPVQSAELAHFVGSLDTDKHEDAILKQAIVSCVVATARPRNDEWFTIASEELGVEKSDLKRYTRDTQPNLSLAILIHVTCQQLHHFNDPSWPSDKFSKVLQAASKFKVQDASPELQNGFCSLWNLLVQKARDREDDDGPEIAQFILRPIYNVYVDIHQDSGRSLLAYIREAVYQMRKALKNPKNPLEYLPCLNDTHHLDLDMTRLSPDHHNRTITFAKIAKLAYDNSESAPAPTFASRVCSTFFPCFARRARQPHPTSQTTPAQASQTNSPRATPAMSLATGSGAAASDGGKPSVHKEMDNLDTPSANPTDADSRPRSLPLVTLSADRPREDTLSLAYPRPIAPRATPAMPLATGSGAAASDGGKPSLHKEMDNFDTPSANPTDADSRSRSLPLVTLSADRPREDTLSLAYPRPIAPRATPAMPLATGSGAAASDGGKPSLHKEMDNLDTPSANLTDADPRSLPVTLSADRARKDTLPLAYPRPSPLLSVTPSADRAHESILDTLPSLLPSADLRPWSLPSVAFSEGSGACRSPVPRLERTGGEPLLRREDDIV
jgi:hypothetical protein